jgi:hypothetical protein
MNLKAIRHAMKAGYEDRGVFEPAEKFWRAVNEVIGLLENKKLKVRDSYAKKQRPRRLRRR